MPLRQLRAIYEKRRTVLAGFSNDYRTDKTKRDQLHGAIAEIDTLLKTIDTLREQEITDNEQLNAKSEGKAFKSKGLDILNRINEKIRVKFEHSETRKNLLNVFVRKCETRTKYEFFAKFAKQEGYQHIAQVFSEFAENENEHAKLIYKYLNMIQSTPENVREAADIELYYHKELYSEFENVARQENFKEFAEFFKNLADIESGHEKKMLKLLKSLHESRLFKSEHIVKWKCRNCGHVAEGKEAPKRCPVCKESQGYFEMHLE